MTFFLWTLATYTLMRIYVAAGTVLRLRWLWVREHIECSRRRLHVVIMILVFPKCKITETSSSILLSLLILLEVVVIKVYCYDYAWLLSIIVHID